MNYFAKSISLVIVTITIIGCGGPLKMDYPVAPIPKNTLPVLFIADPQIHNMYGVGIKQMSYFADKLAKVAIRPPELNILAPYILQDLIKQGQNSSKQKSPLLVVLGDATNIACSGEFDTFLNIVKPNKAKKSLINPQTITFLAHGNHDSYLMGTVNRYVPVVNDFTFNPYYSRNSSGNLEWIPLNMASSAFPTDDSWWGTKVGFPSKNSSKNWRDACYSPIVTDVRKASPMNKSRWLFRYIDHLKDYGLKLSSSTILGNESSIYKLLYQPKPDSKLSKLNYIAQGIWYNPIFSKEPGDGILSIYKSFIVQAFDLGKNHRLILIDTSVCEKAHGGLRYLTTNAGTNACVGEKQIDIIKDILKDKNNRKTIFAGHFPLKDLDDFEQEELTNTFSKYTKKWTYISAHTHNELTGYKWGDGEEANIGSTTDWPMEAHNIYFNTNNHSIKAIHSFNRKNKLKLMYQPTEINTRIELCRHLPAARALANLDTTIAGAIWKSPEGDNDCSEKFLTNQEWLIKGTEFKGYLTEIDRRIYDASNPKYKILMLSIAAAASEQEFESKDITGKFIP